MFILNRLRGWCCWNCWCYQRENFGNGPFFKVVQTQSFSQVTEQKTKNDDFYIVFKLTALTGELTLLDLIRVATYLIVILQLFKFSSFVSFSICFFPWGGWSWLATIMWVAWLQCPAPYPPFTARPRQPAHSSRSRRLSCTRYLNVKCNC